MCRVQHLKGLPFQYLIKFPDYLQNWGHYLSVERILKEFQPVKLPDKSWCFMCCIDIGVFVLLQWVLNYLFLLDSVLALIHSITKLH